MKRIAFLLLLSLPLFAQEKPVTITGIVFGDYYAAVSHHDARVEGMNGFWLRRGYLTFDRAMSDQLAARLRFEVNSPGDFRTNATLEPFIKDAYVRWRSSPALEVYLGLIPTPAYDAVERVWGYRAIEKTPLDLQRTVATRDTGISAIGTHGRMRWHVQAGNGSSTGSETNEGKRIGGAFSLAPTAATVFEVYADFEDRPGATNRATVQGFGGISNDRFRAGVQYAHQTRENANDFDVASIFGVYNLNPRFSLIGRIDRQDANPEGAAIPYLQLDPSRESMLFIAAVDWKLHKNLGIIPNAELVKYEGGGEDDLFARVTFYFTF
jgi:hypothetical protein